MSDEAQMLMKRIDDAKDDWFRILGLELETCTVDDVKQSFKKIVMKLHPDKCKLPGAAEAFTKADKAYKGLNDPEVLKKFKDAAAKKAEQKKYRQSASTLEAWLRQSKQGRGEEYKEPTVEEELSPEARAAADKLKSEREFFMRVERKISEKDERLKRKERQRAEDLQKEAELQDTIGNWNDFVHTAKRRATGPALKQNVGQVRSSDLREADSSTTMDYKLKRKNWQNGVR
eukprot:TRINITY_DN49088_c0_g1_i1.p1 TRINITY_DN49088_c0_g1~~TRINITY_DN49088_c0_g1_i1.p1  ORF type:complete len:231 (+),score=83.96 TRINITY_DN49088_c0_g1_i1:61-753(+)